MKFLFNTEKPVVSRKVSDILKNEEKSKALSDAIEAERQGNDKDNAIIVDSKKYKLVRLG